MIAAQLKKGQNGWRRLQRQLTLHDCVVSVIISLYIGDAPVGDVITSQTALSFNPPKNYRVQERLKALMSEDQLFWLSVGEIKGITEAAGEGVHVSFTLLID